MKAYLWWWVTLLVVLLIAAKISGSGSTAWTVVQYFALSVLGLLLFFFLLDGALEWRDRRRSGRDD